MVCSLDWGWVLGCAGEIGRWTWRVAAAIRGSGLADDLLSVDNLDVTDGERAGRPQGQRRRPRCR